MTPPSTAAARRTPEPGVAAEGNPTHLPPIAAAADVAGAARRAAARAAGRTPERSKARGRTASGRARRTSGAVRPHRRVSGPLAGVAAAAASVAAPGRTLPLPRTRPFPGFRPLPKLAGLGGRALEAGRTLQDSSLLDRLVRSRGWIGLLGFLLFGLVALNVSLLKLNAGAGREAEVARSLRIENAELHGKVARLGSAERLQAEGTRLGLVMPEANDVHYLRIRPGKDERQAANRDQLQPLWNDSDVVSIPAPGPAITAPVTVDPAAVQPAETGVAGSVPGTTTGTTTGTPTIGAAPGQDTVPGATAQPGG